ncbi:hypothetical protein ACMZ49_21335 [Alcaligenes phenolicus]
MASPRQDVLERHRTCRRTAIHRPFHARALDPQFIPDATAEGEPARLLGIPPGLDENVTPEFSISKWDGFTNQGHMQMPDPSHFGNGAYTETLNACLVT